jgi:hypothetical protein
MKKDQGCKQIDFLHGQPIAEAAKGFHAENGLITQSQGYIL